MRDGSDEDELDAYAHTKHSHFCSKFVILWNTQNDPRIYIHRILERETVTVAVAAAVVAVATAAAIVKLFRRLQVSGVCVRVYTKWHYARDCV